MSFGIAYGFVLLLSLPLIFIDKRGVNKIYSAVIIILIGILAFKSYPISTYYSDSIRFDELLNQSRILGFNHGRLNWFFTQSEYSNQPLVALLLWFFSGFKTNGVLRMGTIIIFLTVIRKIINYSGEVLKLNYRNRGTVFVIFLFLFNIYYQIAGIRNYLAFSLLTLGILYSYLDKKKVKKLIGLVLMIISLLLHNSSIIPIIVFLLLIIFRNRSRLLIQWSMLLIQLILPYIFIFLTRFSSIPIVTEIIKKANNYLYGGSTFDNYATLRQIFFTTVLFLFCIFTNYAYKKNVYLVHSKNMDNYYSFVVTMIFLCIGTILNTQIYLRLIQLILFLTIPIMMLLIKETLPINNVNKKSKFINLLWGVSIYIVPLIIFLLWFNVQYFKILV